MKKIEKQMGAIRVQVELPDELEGVGLLAEVKLRPADKDEFERVVVAFGGMDAFMEAHPRYPWLNTETSGEIGGWVDVPEDVTGAQPKARDLPGMVRLRDKQTPRPEREVPEVSPASEGASEGGEGA